MFTDCVPIEKVSKVLNHPATLTTTVVNGLSELQSSMVCKVNFVGAPYWPFTFLSLLLHTWVSPSPAESRSVFQPDIEEWYGLCCPEERYWPELEV